jgi:hypothetical protein
MAAKFTTGELAVLRVVVDEIVENGLCSRSLAEIAARAGVCRTTAQNAIRSAAKLGLLGIEERRRRGRKNLPNLVRVLSREWLAWIEMGGGRRADPDRVQKNRPHGHPDSRGRERALGNPRNEGRPVNAKGSYRAARSPARTA